MSKESVSDAILQTDQSLTEKEKEIEGDEQVKRLDSHALKSLTNLSGWTWDSFPPPRKNQFFISLF